MLAELKNDQNSQNKPFSDGKSYIFNRKSWKFLEQVLEFYGRFAVHQACLALDLITVQSLKAESGWAINRRYRDGAKTSARDNGKVFFTSVCADKNYFGQKDQIPGRKSPILKISHRSGKDVGTDKSHNLGSDRQNVPRCFNVIQPLR